MRMNSHLRTDILKFRIARQILEGGLPFHSFLTMRASSFLRMSGYNSLTAGHLALPVRLMFEREERKMLPKSTRACYLKGGTFETVS